MSQFQKPDTRLGHGGRRARVDGLTKPCNDLGIDLPKELKVA